MQQSEARDSGEQQVELEEVMEIWVLEVVKVLWEDQLEADLEAEEHDQQQQQGLADVLLPPDPQAHQSLDHGAQQAQAQKQVQEQLLVFVISALCTH